MLTDIIGQLMDHLAAVRKPDGLEHTFSAGDLVVIDQPGKTERSAGFEGLHAEVVNCYFQDDPDCPELAWLRPLEDRPDSGGREEFTWPVSKLKELSV